MSNEREEKFRAYLSRKLGEALTDRERSDVAVACGVSANQLSSYLNKSAQPRVPGLLRIVEGLAKLDVDFDLRIPAGVIEDPAEERRANALAKLTDEDRKALGLA